jgi:phospholipid/cholesterol/gamma-HCH transport system substrate-binding protein
MSPVKRATHFRVGMIVFITILLLTMAGVLLGLFGQGEKPARYYVLFEGSVIGLRERASDVLYRGVKIGQVADIRVDSTAPEAIAVGMDIDPYFQITESMEAEIILTDLTGIRSILLTGGASSEPVVKPGGAIKGRPLFLEEINEMAEGFIEPSRQLISNVNALLDEKNRQNVSGLLVNIQEISDEVSKTAKDLLTDENRELLSSTLKNVSRASNEAAELPATMVESLERINTLLVNVGESAEKMGSQISEVAESARTILDDPNLADSLEKASQLLGKTSNLADTMNRSIESADLEGSLGQLGGLIGELTITAKAINQILGPGQGDILEILANLRKSSENLREFTGYLRSNPSAIVRAAPREERRP